MTQNKTILGRDYDRDKNLTYRPQDESADLPIHSRVSLEISRYETIIAVVLKQLESLDSLSFHLTWNSANEIKAKIIAEIVERYIKIEECN